MNRLDITRRKQAISALVEGNSIRATCRMTGVAKGPVLKLLADVGRACARYQDEHLRNLACKRIQCDEIWAFCYAKDRNLPNSLYKEDRIRLGLDMDCALSRHKAHGFLSCR